MTATSHALIGTIIAAKFPDPVIAIPLALASHFVADMIPHWDEALNRKNKGRNRLLIETAADIALGFALSYSLIYFFFPQTNFFYALAIIFVAQLPDWLMGLYFFFKLEAFKWAYHIGKITNREIDKPWGILTQVFTILLLVFLAQLF